MIYGILSEIIIILIIISIYFYRKNNKNIKLNKELTQEVIKISNQPIIIGEIHKYTDEDIAKISSNPEFIRIILKYLSYSIAKKTDLMRNLENTQEKIGQVNALHEIYLFFYKILEKKDEIKKSGQNLI